MQAPKLLIRKAVVNVQNRKRPCIQVQATVDPKLLPTLNEHFAGEILFKRTSYQNGFPEGTPAAPAPLVPHIGAMLKNDACPEITVKAILAGQLYQASGIWDMKAFEYIAMRAFDSLVEMLVTVAELGRETVYAGIASDLAAFAADASSDDGAVVEDLPAPPSAVAPGCEGVADAA